MNDITADGQVFRVDMRLRPGRRFGRAGVERTALEQYLITQGREWERYAWCKGRVVTPYLNDIKSLVRPFVFRKYLDYSAYEAMRNLHRQIRSEVSKKGMADNIKLGAGGIREVEFIAQIFQMIRGGQMRALQLKGTQETLKKLAELGIMPSENVETLLAAYRSCAMSNTACNTGMTSKPRPCRPRPNSNNCLPKAWVSTVMPLFQTASMFIGTKSISCLTKS